MTPAGFASVDEMIDAIKFFVEERTDLTLPGKYAINNSLDSVKSAHNAAVSKAVQEEREACAKMCDSFADEVKSTLGSYNQYPYQRVARAIRSRGK